jgi:hypothetical protein
MKIELKHIAPYLPYGLNWYCLDKDSREWENLGLSKIHLDNEILEIGNMDIEISELGISDDMEVKLILRPLSDHTKEIEVNGEKFVPKDWLNENFIGETIGTNIATWSHRAVDKLFEWHFDVFGLIEKKLAVDINSLNK